MFYASSTFKALQDNMKIQHNNSIQWFSSVVLLSWWIVVFWLLNLSPWTIVGAIILFFGLSHLPQAWHNPIQTNFHFDISRYLVHIFASGLPVLLFWLLYHTSLKGWWMIDDPCILEYVDRVGPIAGFFDPSQKFNTSFYAPLQNFSLGIDYLFFGLNPSGFYWHHLLSFSLTLLLIYAVLSFFFAPLLASMIVSLFVVRACENIP